MVIFFKQNFQDIIFTPSREDMNTQKWFRDHLKKWPFSGPDPLLVTVLIAIDSALLAFGNAVILLLILFVLFGWRELLGEFGKKRSAAK